MTPVPVPVPVPLPARRPRHRQSGIALPVMLIMLTVMLISSIYLLKSSTSTTLTTANLAYDSSLSKAVDLGVHTGFQWLSTANGATLIADVPASGYVSHMTAEQKVSDPAFWTGSTTIADSAGNQIEYVIHRICQLPGLMSAVNQNCMQSVAESTTSAAAGLGDSLSSSSVKFTAANQLHFVITARIFGARGSNVVNQSIVMLGPLGQQ